jgi:N-acetylglucosamine-6-sulfatase
MLRPLAALLLMGAMGARAGQPNFIWMITDDQNADTYALMPHLQRELQQGGTEFSHAYVASPKCCPSRTSALSGRFPHNLEDPRLGWCGNFSKGVEDKTFVLALQQAGYRTSMAGKYYNQEDAFCGENLHAPKGYSDLFVMCQEERYFNIPYANCTDGVCNTVPTGDAPTDYVTAQVGNHSLSFITKALADGVPFYSYVSLHAPHLPATPAPWYADAIVPSRAPRTPNWNTGMAGKHYQVATNTPMNEWLIAASDNLYADRLRALMSVDDVIGALFAELRTAGALDNTYVVYSSDHGYHLGQFALWAEKSEPYESDVRIPLFMRGPNVGQNVTTSALASSMDIGATILELAGVTAPGQRTTDGRSLVPVLHAPPDGAAPPWRDRVLTEFFGWMNEQFLSPCDLPPPGQACPDPAGQVIPLIDSTTNVFSALRILNSTADLLYVEYRPQGHSPLSPASTNFTEAYNLTADPWQMVNLALPGGLPPATLAALSSELWAVATCAGATCP